MNIQGLKSGGKKCGGKEGLTVQGVNGMGVEVPGWGGVKQSRG